MRSGDEWQKRIVRDSKRWDLMYDIYDAENSIDTEFLLGLNQKQQTRCFYCEIPMAQHNRNISQGLTLERLDTTMGHIKSNCVLCCKRCNSKRLHRHSNHSSRIRELFIKWNNQQPPSPDLDSGRRPCLA